MVQNICNLLHPSQHDLALLLPASAVIKDKCHECMHTPVLATLFLEGDLWEVAVFPPPLL